MRKIIEQAKARHEQFWEECCEEIGVAGSMVAGICCLGIPGLVSVFSALGLGFLINNPVRIWLLVTFLVLTLGGLFMGMLHHSKPWALLLGLANAGLIYVYTLVIPDPIMTFVGIGGLVAATVLNIWYEHHKVLRERLSPLAARYLGRLSRRRLKSETPPPTP